MGREDGVDGAELSGQAHELRAHGVTLQLRLPKVHTPRDAQHSRERVKDSGGGSGCWRGGGASVCGERGAEVRTC